MLQFYPLSKGELLLWLFLLLRGVIRVWRALSLRLLSLLIDAVVAQDGIPEDSLQHSFLCFALVRFISTTSHFDRFQRIVYSSLLLLDLSWG